MAPPLG